MSALLLTTFIDEATEPQKSMGNNIPMQRAILSRFLTYLKHWQKMRSLSASDEEVVNEVSTRIRYAILRLNKIQKTHGSNEAPAFTRVGENMDKIVQRIGPFLSMSAVTNIGIVDIAAVNDILETMIIDTIELKDDEIAFEELGFWDRLSLFFFGHWADR